MYYSMAKKTSTTSSTEEVQIIESVGSGKSLTPTQVENLAKHANEDQPFLTYFIKYGAFIGIALFSIGSLIQLYLAN